MRGPLHTTEDGDKRVSKCTYSKKKGWEPCSYKLLAFFPRGTTKGEVSWNGEIHSHSQLSVGAQEPVPNRPIDARTGASIAACVNDGLKPTQLLRKLRCEGLLVPPTVQLVNCVACIRRKQGVSCGFTSANSLLG